MNDTEPGPRRYSEKEFGLILRRATELQRAEPAAPDPAGLTLTELEDIAAEAGIDPVLLRRAANELHILEPPTLGARMAGAPVSIRIERVVDGEFPRERLEELVPVMQAATAGQGTASAVGRTLTWSSRTESNTSAQQVLVAVRDGETLIRVEESFGGLAGGLFGGIVGGVGGGVGLGMGGALAGALGSVALAFAFPVAVIAGSYALARGIFKAQVQRRQAQAHSLVDRLAERVQGAVRGEASGISGGPEAIPPPSDEG